MNLAILATELAKPEYASLTDQQAADAINAKTVSLRQLVPTWRVKQYAIEQSIWAKVKLALRKSDTADEVYGLCIQLVDWVDDSAGKIQSVDVDLSSVQMMLGGLVQIGIATQEQVNAIIAMGSVTRPWTTHNGLPEIGIGLVRNMRLQNAQ
jgi:hypothetical protein